MFVRAYPRSLLCAVCAINLAINLTTASKAAEHRFDIVVYGGTSAGVAAAVQATRMDKTVAVVCPDQHLGGLSSGGLGWTDTGNKAVIGGIAREFYHRVWQHYQHDDAWQWQPRAEYGNRGQGTAAIDGDQRTMWIFEPHVAELVFDALVAEHAIPVFKDQWLDRDQGVEVKSGRIRSIRTLSGERYIADAFVDATYEGDLMAAAGVEYHVGREGQSQYGEQWAGVQTGVLHHRHHFGVLPPISPYVEPNDPESGVLPLVSPDPPGEYGSADRRIQAYCFRMCLTNHPENRVPFPRPEAYDPARYELLKRIYAAGWKETFDKFDPIPNHKTDTNNHGPLSTDNIGANYDYPEASYERRREIVDQHRRYQQGWLYFVANDPGVPEDVRLAMSQWGLCKDEFKDNENWPHQIYVREARRMVGAYVMTEHELLARRPTPESIGMGSYTIDSHNVQRYITPDGHVQNEGDIGVHTPFPYQIALGSVLPKAQQCTNLVVPVCVSSSHIAFGSIRMEPVFMILGQSAATVAALAIDKQVPVQEVPYRELRERLLTDKQVLEIEVTTSNGGLDPKSLEGIVVDDRQAAQIGKWEHSHANTPFVAHGYQHDGNRQDGTARLTFACIVPKAGKYELRLYFPTNGNRASNALLEVNCQDTYAEYRVNQKTPREESQAYTAIGKFDWQAGDRVTVSLSNAEADGYVVADAIAWVPVD